MQVRWSFFLALMVGLILAVAGYFGLFHLQLGVPTEQSRWCYEILQKKTTRARAIGEPKLILVGGSSVLFGLSAREIQRQTGYPTVNFGTHAAFSLDYMLELTRRIAHPGDTVMLALEYELYKKNPRILRVSSDSIFNDYLVARDPEFVSRLPWWERFNLVMLTPPTRIQIGLENRFAEPRMGAPRAAVPASGTFNVYLAENINEYGDQTGATKARRPAEATPRSRLSGALAHGLPDNPAGFPSVRAFCDWAQGDRVRVLATFPAKCHHPEYERPEARKTPLQLREFYRQRSVPVLGDAGDAIFPESECFDTADHLTEEASLVRTQRLLPHLIPYLQSTAGSAGGGTTPNGVSAR